MELGQMGRNLEDVGGRIHGLVAGAAVFGVLLSACFAADLSSQDRIPCTVERVVDGDTFVCRGGERVRFLLIDAPEMAVEPLGPLARDFLAELLPPGIEVSMELDVGERDRYGRLLAYVYLPDGRMVNEVLAREGFAQTMVIQPNVRYVERIRDAVSSARAANAGLWGMTDSGSITPEPPGRETSSGDRRDGGSAGQGCDPSYPTICVPSPPPDLECGDIPFQRFVVVGADPHHFDGDGDGVGCEVE
jgi:endonuclease YncB( thermonuclease family)